MAAPPWWRRLFPAPQPLKGPTMIPTDFKGRARRLDAWDFGRLGRLLKVGEDELRAVAEVECAGSGFDAQGRPRMLPEPHVFWRELGEAKRKLAETQGLAYPRWGTRPYPADSYLRLTLMLKIDRPAALRSASWGLGQIMGFNHRLAGYASVEDMVAAFCDDEEHHLEAMVRFIQSEHLDDDLRRHDWSGFARGYNGAGYASHGYHTKLAAAHARWSRRPDTPVPAGAA
jgi:hypothetical protein